MNLDDECKKAIIQCNADLKGMFVRRKWYWKLSGFSPLTSGEEAIFKRAFMIGYIKGLDNAHKLITGKDDDNG